MKLIINNFDKLSTEVQEEIQDFIAGYTPDFFNMEKNHCDACGKEKYLHRVDTEGGIIRICGDCIVNGRDI